MNDRVRLLALLALVTIAAFGQDSARTGTERAGGMGWSVSVGAVPSVTGAPYSAEETTERIQTLADGTHITQPSTTVRIYRDSEGRTRTERPLPPRAARQPDGTEAPAMVVITDPVAHVTYTLSARDKVARKQTIQIPENRPTLQRHASSGASAVAHDAPPLRTSREPADAERPKTTREKLGNQTIEGVPVEGTRRTTTWPVGSRGNDRPITIVNETWTSPDLRVVVLSKDSNPMTGDTTRKLTNITRGEPDPSLFQPPSDYTVITQETEGSFHD